MGSDVSREEREREEITRAHQEHLAQLTIRNEAARRRAEETVKRAEAARRFEAVKRAEEATKRAVAVKHAEEAAKRAEATKRAEAAKRAEEAAKCAEEAAKRDEAIKRAEAMQRSEAVRRAEEAEAVRDNMGAIPREPPLFPSRSNTLPDYQQRTPSNAYPDLSELMINPGNNSNANDLQYFDHYPNKNNDDSTGAYVPQLIQGDFVQDAIVKALQHDYKTNQFISEGRSPNQGESLFNNPSPTSSGRDDFVMVDHYYSQGNSSNPYTRMPSAPFENDLNNVTSGSSSQKSITCDTCGQEFGMTIYQCSSGHSACERCKRNGLLCAKCSLDILDMRNYNLEAMLREMKIDCPNSSEGCSLRLRSVDMPIHLGECIFREMACPAAVFGRCNWRGKRGVEMLRHFDDVHMNHRQASVDQEMSLKYIDNDDRILHLVPIGGYLFLVQIKITKLDQTLAMAVQLIGTKSQAAKWTYEIHIFNKNEPRRKLQYIDTCKSDFENGNEIFNQGLVLPLRYVHSYFCKESLLYKFYITRSDVISRSNRPVRGGGRGRRGVSR